MRHDPQSAPGVPGMAVTGFEPVPYASVASLCLSLSYIAAQSRACRITVPCKTQTGFYPNSHASERLNVITSASCSTAGARTSRARTGASAGLRAHRPSSGRRSVGWYPRDARKRPGITQAAPVLRVSLQRSCARSGVPTVNEFECAAFGFFRRPIHRMCVVRTKAAGQLASLIERKITSVGALHQSPACQVVFPLGDGIGAILLAAVRMIHHGSAFRPFDEVAELGSLFRIENERVRLSTPEGEGQKLSLTVVGQLGEPLIPQIVNAGLFHLSSPAPENPRRGISKKLIPECNPLDDEVQALFSRNRTPLKG